MPNKKRNKSFKCLSLIALPLTVLAVFAFSPDFTKVAGGKAGGDRDAPVIDDYVFDKASINTENGAQTLTMYLRISDATGVSDEFPPTIQFVPQNDPGFVYPEMVEFSFSLMESGCGSLPSGLDVSGLVGCGDDTDGIYEASVTIPRYSTSGLWNVDGVWNLSDTLGNSAEQDALEAFFRNNAKVYDTERPVLESISITPSSFDTSNGPQTIRIEMHITDDLAGVDVDSIVLAGGLVSVTAPFGEDTYWNEPCVLDSGTARDGIYVMRVVMPKDATSGFWMVHSIDMGDKLNRARRYTTTDLALEFPDLPLYLLNQGTTDEVELQSDWTLEDWPYYQEGQVVWPDVSVRFQEGTVISKEEGGVFAFHRMLLTKYDLIDSTSVSNLLDEVNSDYDTDLLECDAEEGCVDTDVNDTNLEGSPLHIIKSGIPGLNLSFSKPITIIVGMDDQYLGETFVVQTYDESQNGWVEHGTCTVEMIEPESTEHGGTAYGETRPVEYAGCSFTTDHASFFSVNAPSLPETGSSIEPVLISVASAAVVSGAIIIVRSTTKKKKC